MKKALLFTFLLFTTISLGQDYKKEWSKVLEKEANGELKQAATLTDIIYNKAKKDKNQPQIIKAFFFKAKYMQVLEEDAQFKIIMEIQINIKNAQFPSNKILSSIYAEMLSKIYTRNSSRIQSFIPPQHPGNDYRQWGSKNFKDEIDRLYKTSLENRDVLYQIPLSEFDAIIDFAPALSSYKRPLYDFLAECYLNDLWKNTDSQYNLYWNKKTALLFGDTTAFLKCIPNDSLPYTAKTGLRLLQEIEKHYADVNDNINLERAVLRRLSYLDSKVFLNDKNAPYIATVSKIAANANKTPITYNAKLIKAQLLTRQADKVKFKNNLVDAVALYNEIINNKAENDITPQAINLKNDILSKTASLKMEQFIAPCSPSLASINFKNLDSITISFYKTPYAATVRDDGFRDKYITDKKPVLQKKYALPNKGDYYTYSTEVILPPLPNGNFAIAISPVGKNESAENILIVETITVSQLLILIDEHANIGINYQVVDHFTGKPVENVKAYTAKQPELRTGKDGKINVRFSNRKNDNYITFIHQGDTLEYKFYDSYYNDNKDYWLAGAKLYLDRAIYRPGQTVYFKGVAKQDNKGIVGIVANTYFTVTVEDETGDDIKIFRLKTNEFGSFTDKLELPKNKTGRFSISIEEDDDDKPGYDEVFWDGVNFERFKTSFQVEEYKRPKFDVTFNTIKDVVRLNEMFAVKGSAKSFSSAAISDAEVVYRVQRNSKRYWHDSYGGQDQEIKEGKTITDADGNFSILFTAEPDDSYDPKDLPVFSYTVYADVTDSNGETHSSTITVNAGYHSLTVSASVPGIINTNEKTSVEMVTNNLNGQFIAARGKVTIYKISSPLRYLAKRPFADPEIQMIPEQEFVHTFPFIPYKTVNDSVIKQNPVFSQTVNTGAGKQLQLNGLQKWQSGNYELIFTAIDSTGNEISTTERFTLKNDNDRIPADKELFEYNIKNIDYATDGYVEIELSTGVPLSVNVIADGNDKRLYEMQHDLDTGKKSFKVPLPENPKTPIKFLISYVWQNEYYQNSFSALVLTKTETLSIEAQVINSKLTPGNKETWSFSVLGSKKLSEVLASMYDASLDKLVTNNYYSNNDWEKLGLFHYDNGRYLYRNLLTTGIASASFTERLPRQSFFNSTDAIYRYGFEFDNFYSAYFAYAPKGQLRKKEDYTINGRVTDSLGLPLAGAAITIKGTHEGTLTDLDGNYSLFVSKGTDVTFTLAGYQTEYRNIASDSSLNISLKEESAVDATMELGNVVVEAYRTTTRATSNFAVTTITSKTIEGRHNANFIQTLQGQVPGLTISTASGQPGASSTVMLRGLGSINDIPQPLYVIDGIPLGEDAFKNIDPADITSLTVLKDAGAISIYGSRGANGVIIINTKSGAKEIEALQQVKARKNFDETAFFYPQLKTDKNGNVSFSFTTPEALTEWKLRLMAHNKNAASVLYQETFFTQKDLMIVPNMPRFLREKDTITLIAKVTNLTGEVKTGNALLQLFDATTMAPADAQMLNIKNLQPFTIPPKGNTTVQWKITIPKGMQGVQYKVLAKAGNFSDGEENILPVLTNSVMVSESIPFWVKPNSTKEYSFRDFDKSFSNKNISQVGMTLEYTSNPAWLALQSLPYLMEFEHECAEQVFSRYYANSIATRVLNSNPKIAEVFAAWRKDDRQPSKFEQNEELKSIVVSETPWILENQSSEEIKNRLALLFDFDKMKTSLEAGFVKLQNKQAASGGFPWFEGGKESGYITRHIAAGFGHLSKMGINADNKKAVDAMTKKAVSFMDSEFLSDHNRRLSYLKKGKTYSYDLSYDAMHYLYARSFYLEQYPISDSIKKMADSYLRSMNMSTAYLKMKWLDYSLYEKGLTAIIMNRYGYKDVAKKILNHLKETSSNNEEWGMYWIENKAGWNWYKAPIETQALLIEAFTEIDNDITSADAMKVWLLKNKQNKNWPTTKSTVEAVYALLMKGTDWLSVKDNTTFKFGDQKAIDDKIAENDKEAGTGYIKLQWKPEEIKQGMGTLTVENKSAVPGFGGFYWQRAYEEADKDYNPTQGILSITKELYIKINTSEGVQLQAITKEKPLKIGDLVTVKLIINAKEDMEYLHLKDMRASAFEPVDVISERKYNNGTSYYQSTRDVATHFFFDSLNKGVYVIEYDVKVNNSGDYSNGIATIQSMYAPEFSGNSKSVRLHIE